MKINQEKKGKLSINFIFTGKFLYIWYTLFALVVLSMLINLWMLSSVQEFRFTVYTPTGQPASAQIVSKEALEGLTNPLKTDFVFEKGIEPYRTCLFFQNKLCWKLVRGESS
ncbi:MAG: hypothetical protein LBP51_07680 [Deferribacteraceae bacterium]|nr:hypothetical protein [Deferribacteraceae bacterium]